MIGRILQKQDEQDINQGNANAALVRQRSWGEYISILSGLPGVREVWGMGNISEIGLVYGATTQGRTLTRNGGIVHNIYNHVVPYADYNGISGYHSRADESGLDVLGNEAVIDPAIQGMTLLVWYWPNASPTTAGLVYKADTAGAGDDNFHHAVVVDIPEFRVYNGAASDIAVGLAVTPATWHCNICRFKPGIEVSLDSDGEKFTTATALTSLTNSTQPLTIGAAFGSSIVSTFLTGRIAVVALAGAWIDDDFSRFLYRYGRALMR